MSDVLALAQALISRRSVTPEDAGCQALLAARLGAAGFDCERLRLGEVENLWATHGTGGPVLVLLGHTDVVPPGPREAWASEPFVPEIRDGVLYGRGAEGDAVDGVRRVADLFRERGQPIDWCVTGEPSSKAELGDLLRVGRRGSLSATLDVHGVQGHVAYPDKASNPVHLALPALAALVARRWDDGYETFPPTSLQVSNIAAGTGATNVIPGDLRVLFNLRYNPHWDAATLERECEAVLQANGLQPGDGYTLHWHRSGEPFHTPEGPLRSAARDVLAAHLGAAPEESTGGGTSDARFIAPLGAHCIELGPVNASIHKVDEHVSVADLEALPGLYLALVERLLA